MASHEVRFRISIEELVGLIFRKKVCPKCNGGLKRNMNDVLIEDGRDVRHEKSISYYCPGCQRVVPLEELAGKIPKLLKPLINLIILGSFLMFFVWLMGNIFHSSPPYQKAIDSIQNNVMVIQTCGGIKRFGFFSQGHSEYGIYEGTADFQIDVIGNKRNITVAIELSKHMGNDWVVDQVTFYQATSWFDKIGGLLKSINFEVNL